MFAFYVFNSYFAPKDWITSLLVNLCQELLFLHQLNQNMTTDCLLNYLQVQCMKIPGSNLGRTCCVQKLFLTFKTIFVHNMFSPCSAKRRSSDKNLPVPNNFNRKTYPSDLPLLFIRKYKKT